MATNLQRYNTVAVILHWVTAVLMIYMLFWGEGLIKARGGETAANPTLHVSLGILILVLAVLRLIWRLMNPPPPDLPGPAWQRWSSHALHWAFYALMILLPLSGMAALDHTIHGRHPEFAGLTFFGMFSIPHFPLSWFGGMHDGLHVVAIFLLILHVLAALKHQFIDKDGTLRRMSLQP